MTLRLENISKVFGVQPFFQKGLQNVWGGGNGVAHAPTSSPLF
ncbi:hypothetical protein [Acidocella sp. MX-AZ02]|nr:hypothetical protein [Acidocella sp. MX-AZ02]